MKNYKIAGYIKTVVLYVMLFFNNDIHSFSEKGISCR